MSTIHFHQTVRSTPEHYVAGLTDFGAGRSKLFSNSADEYLKVHYRGPTEADVTEGSGGIWERLHYDWSDPKRVVLTTTDSNVWAGASGYSYTFTRQPKGTTDIDVVVVREGKNVKGRALGFVLRTIGHGLRYASALVSTGVQLNLFLLALAGRRSGGSSPRTEDTDRLLQRGRHAWHLDC